MSTTKPDLSLDQIIHLLTTTWNGKLDRPTHTWYFPSGTTPQISYALDVAPYWVTLDRKIIAGDDAMAKGLASANGIIAMDARQMDAARLAFQLWDDLVPFDIVQSPTNSNSSGIIVNVSTGTGGKT